MKRALRQDEKFKEEMHCMKAKLLFVTLSLAAVLTSAGFLGEGHSARLYADKMITNYGGPSAASVVQKA